MCRVVDTLLVEQEAIYAPRQCNEWLQRPPMQTTTRCSEIAKQFVGILNRDKNRHES